VFQFSENFHVAVEARRAASDVLGDERIRRLGVFGEANQFRIRRAIEAPWVGECLGKISLGETEEFLTLCEPWMQDMAFRRLEGFSWDDIGEAYGVSGHAAQSRFSHALQQALKRLKI